MNNPKLFKTKNYGEKMKYTVNTANAPAAIGPYSQAVVIRGGHIMFTAGQIPMDPISGEIIGSEIREQTRRVMQNIKGILEAEGASMSNILKTTIFMKNMQDYPGLNEVYKTFFSETFPARSAVEVNRLPKDVLVEIEAIAVLDR
jgi:2-iminobutanoate/2-iminopropanoate deaminase